MTKEEFKQIRTSLGLSQRKLAKIMGKNYRTIQRYESGEWSICVEIAARIQELGYTFKVEAEEI